MGMVAEQSRNPKEIIRSMPQKMARFGVNVSSDKPKHQNRTDERRRKVVGKYNQENKGNKHREYPESLKPQDIAGHLRDYRGYRDGKLVPLPFLRWLMR